MDQAEETLQEAEVFKINSNMFLFQGESEEKGSWYEILTFIMNVV